MDSEKELEKSKDELIRQVQNLRRQNDLEDGTQISLYIAATPLVHSILVEHRSQVREAVNAVDIVEVDPEAGIPLPEPHPHSTFTLGDDKVTVALEEA